MHRFLLTSLLTLIVGCSTDKPWVEPQTKPVADYAESGLIRLRKLPVLLEIESPDLAMVNEKGLFGGVSVAGRFPVREVMRKECESFISSNFRPATAYQNRYVVLRITMSRVLLMQKWSEVVSELAYKVELIHPTDATVRNYFSKTYVGMASNRKKGKGVVPESVYLAAQKVLGAFGDEICRNPQIIRRLETDFGLNDDGRVVRPPSMKSFELGQGKSGVYRGRCVYQCNDEPSENVSLLAKEYIANACWNKLGITKERVRIVYDEEKLENGVWTFSFRTFGRMELAFSYDPDLRQGVCTADLGLMKKSVQEATEIMRRYIFDQLRTYGGPVSSPTADMNTLVRFDVFKTDAQNELLSVAFSVVY